MKRTMKKVFALALAVMLVMALTVSAFASETQEPTAYPEGAPYEITVTVPESITNPGTFSAYQIFAGDLAKTTDSNEQGLILSNITWGSAITDPAAALQAANEALITTCTTPAELAAAINDRNIEAFADAIADYAKDPVERATNVKPVGSGSPLTATLSVDAPGYYMVKSNKPDGEVTNYAETRYILQVVGDVEIDEKADVPSVKKTVTETNDTTNVTAEGKTADYDIGDEVPFTLTGTLPSNYDKYDTYKYVFHDTLSTGLKFIEESIKVKVDKVGEKELIEGSDYTVTYSASMLTIEIANLKGAAPDAAYGSEVVVTYNATLEEGAVIGNDGNPNEVYLEFSNNPNVGGEGDTGTTPPDKVVVFTYQLNVDKVNEENEPLEGAGFTLSKLVKNAEGEDVYQPIAFKPVEKTMPDGSKQTIYVVASGGSTEISGEKITSFPFGGLDDGQYMLEETTTPPGYNTIKPVEFTVTAEHDDATQALTSVTFAPSAAATAAGVVITSGTGAAGEGSIGIGSTQIVNQKGTQLPSTGGMGTTILYIVGGVLAVGAAVILVVRKRMQSRQQSNQ